MTENAIDLRGAAVLIVDDVPDDLDILCRSLDKADYDVLVATSGAQAIDIATRARPELILLDVMMPEMDGYETCRQLKMQETTRDIPVIFLTALTQPEQIVEGFRVGGIDYMTKPFHQEEVLVRIQTHLERTRLASELARLNSALEAEVQARTRDLQLRLRELEGKDRIAEHLLKYHTLEETLELVLQVVAQLVEIERAAFYLREDDTVRIIAALGRDGRAIHAEQLAQSSLTSSLTDEFAQLKAGQSVLRAEKIPRAILPLARGGEVLGILEVVGPVLGDEELRLLNSFGLQAAVAISDALIQQDMGKWEEQLDEVLEVDDNLQLEDLEGDLEL
jgi:DNA-binding response OmpR family regulator